MNEVASLIISYAVAVATLQPVMGRLVSVRVKNPASSHASFASSRGNKASPPPGRALEAPPSL